MNVKWSYSEIFPLHLYWRRKCPSVNLTTVTVSTNTFFSFRRRLSLFFFFSLAQLWSLSLFSLRGCEQKAIKPLQSLVRHRYRNERWRDGEIERTLELPLILRWNGGINDWVREGKKDGHGGVLAEKEKRKATWLMRWGERECETCKCLIVGACLKITECSDEKWE